MAKEASFTYNRIFIISSFIVIINLAIWSFFLWDDIASLFARNHSGKIIYEIKGFGDAIDGESMRVMHSICNDFSFSTYDSKSNYFFSLSAKKSFIVIRDFVNPIDSRLDIILIADSTNNRSGKFEFKTDINGKTIPNYISQTVSINPKAIYKKGNIGECTYIQLVLPSNQYDIGLNPLNISIIYDEASRNDSVSISSKNTYYTFSEGKYEEFNLLDGKDLNFTNDKVAQLRFISYRYNSSLERKVFFNRVLLEIVLHTKWDINNRKYALHCLKELDKGKIVFTPISYLPRELENDIDKDFLIQAEQFRMKLLVEKNKRKKSVEPDNSDAKLDTLLRSTAPIGKH